MDEHSTGECAQQSSGNHDTRYHSHGSNNYHAVLYKANLEARPRIHPTWILKQITKILLINS